MAVPAMGPVQAIARRACAHPERIALSQGEEQLTYSALWDGAGRVAERLRAAGVSPGDVVGVHLERRPALLVVLLGIWRAGAAYLPLDPQFPPDRLAYMAADAGTRLLVHDGVIGWPASGAAQVTLTSLLHASDAPDAPDALDDLDAPDRPAYLIYTSGSTGRPKGVEVPHRALANFLRAMAHAPGVTEHDTLLAVTTLSFDIAALELWLPLVLGGRVEIARDDELMQPAQLLERLRASRATVMQATPVTWRMLLSAGWTGPLRLALCGGEAFPVELVAPLCERAEAVWNMYGPTETTIWSTIARVDAERDRHRVSIGMPIDNTWLYVMDERGQPVTGDAAGELWIGGEGVARGYRNQPELTASAFVRDPCDATRRAYRTGDLVRQLPSGELLHLGRLDQQLKINGFRIEPAEIEGAIARLPGVAQAVVSLGGPPDDPRLVAYVRPAAGAATTHSASDVRRALRQVLPGYMIPAMVVEIDAVPLTPNGKVDRRALPDPFAASSAASAASEEPMGETERRIAAVWRDVLQLERVGRHDNFFELGGHSLLALRAAAQLEAQHGLVVDVRAMFFSTLAQLATS